MTRPVSLVALALAGCAVEADLETASAALSNCPSWGCGSNSPVIDLWGFHELDEGGGVNGAGIKLLGLEKGGRSYTPEVIGTELIGHSDDPASYPSITGAELAGSHFVLDTPGGVVPLHIRKESRITSYWVGKPELIATYELDYELNGLLRPVCNDPPDEGPVWPMAKEAILFEGDRYDADAKTVIDVDDTRWFNIACAGSALAKLVLNRQVTVASDDKPDVASRQALLKLFVSDVCGTGQAFTHEGEPLLWGNAPLDGKVASYEAVWDQDGALCMNTHRLDGDPDYPTIAADIAHACAKAGRALPACDDTPSFPQAWPNGGLLVSANPD
jgi:hypothetical protein